LTNAESGDHVDVMLSGDHARVDVDADDITEIVFHSDIYQDPIEEDEFQSTSTSVGQTDIIRQQETPAKKKNKKSTSDAILQALKEKKEDRERLMKTLESAFEEKDEDEIDLFFKSVALTVKNFSPAEKAETKLKVMELVTGIEMRRLTSN
jgi:hypothetical protein